ncbi:hypothetical protein RKD18_003613 [Streptomyces phaeoluteigriseus]
MRRPTVRRPLHVCTGSGTAEVPRSPGTPHRANDEPNHELNVELNPELVNR